MRFLAWTRSFLREPPTRSGSWASETASGDGRATSADQDARFQIAQQSRHVRERKVQPCSSRGRGRRSQREAYPGKTVQSTY